MRHVFILNPAAGKANHAEKYIKIIRAACEERSLDYAIRITEKAGDEHGFALEEVKRGDEVRLYACGGDGTLNGVVNAVVGYPNAAVTHFPCGSGNDAIKIFSNPSAFFDIEKLLDAKEATFDLIECNGAYALDILSMGFDARVGTGASAYKRLPFVTGMGAYILSLINCLLHGIASELTVTLENGEVIGGRKTMICVCNGRFYGGGFNPVPEAEPDDGILDVLIVKKVGLIKLLQVVGSYQKGQYANFPELIRHVSCRKLTISAPQTVVINFDGEAHWADSANIQILPQAVRFFYPKELTYHYTKK